MQECLSIYVLLPKKCFTFITLFWCIFFSFFHRKKNVQKLLCTYKQQNVYSVQLKKCLIKTATIDPLFLSIGRHLAKVWPVVSSILSCTQFYSDIIIMGDHDPSNLFSIFSPMLVHYKVLEA